MQALRRTLGMLLAVGLAVVVLCLLRGREDGDNSEGGEVGPSCTRTSGWRDAGEETVGTVASPVSTPHPPVFHGPSCTRTYVAANYVLPDVPDLKLDRDPDFGTPRFVRRRAGFLSAAAPGAAPEEVVRSLLVANGRAFTLHHSDVLDPGNAKKVRDCVTKHNGMRSLTWQQQHDGIDIYGARCALNLTADNRIINVQSRALHIPCVRFHDVVKVTAEEARRTVLRAVPNGAEHRSTQDLWYPLDMVSVVKAWDLFVQRGHETHRVIVRADTGEVVEDICLTCASAKPATFNVYTGDSPEPLSPGPDSPTNVAPVEVARELVALSALDTNASPEGWIPAGETRLVGNNAVVYADRDDDDSPDAPPLDGGTNRVFDLPLDLTQNPSTYADASQVQAFYLANFFHDRLYRLGFDEAAGNFQTDNFGRGGRGGDALVIEVQNGGNLGFGSANRAWYTGYGDGSRGKVCVSVFGRSSPHRCGVLDGQLVVHEMAHGVSSRLIGDGTAWPTVQARGLAEGWSDFFALALFTEPDDDLHGCYPFATYSAIYQDDPGAHYYGIRRFPYSTDMTKAPQTVADIDPNQIAFPPEIPRNPSFGSEEADQIHNIGEAWCLMLWECRANLVERYGFSGNELMLQLVVDGMKLSPENPTFVEARDAVLQADLVNSGGTNQVDLWRGFAKRGLGYSASVPGAVSTVGIVEGYDLPFDVRVDVAETTGDGNGYVEPGESGALTLVLTSHELALSNVTATLTVESSNVIATVTNTIVPDVAAGSTATSAVPFRFSVGTGFPGFSDARLTVRVTSDKGTFNEPVAVRIGNPIDYPPEITDIVVSDVSEHGATITWRTGIAATGHVEYGITAEYPPSQSYGAACTEGTKAGEWGTGMSNRVVLAGLAKGTVYHYRIHATGTNGLSSVTGDLTFRTDSKIYVYAWSEAAEELGTIEAPFRSLQAAAEAAKPTGDEILVAMGTYTGRHPEAVLNMDGSDWDLTISGGYAPDFSIRDHELFVTTIDGQRQRRGIRLDNGAKLCISGMTITRGQGEWGGGVHVRKSEFDGRECMIENSSSVNGVNHLGGGVFSSLGSSVRIERCVVLSNFAANRGGGVFTSASGTHTDAIECRFEGNQASLAGGGVRVELGSTIHLESCQIAGNVTGLNGGGVSVAPFSEATIDQSTVAGNAVTNASLTNSHGGGGIGVAGNSSSARATLRGSVLQLNLARWGKDIHCAARSQVDVNHCNVGDIYGNLVFSNSLSRADPLFARPERGDFHLLYGSPCIDTGEPDYVGTAADMDGEPRPFGVAIDIGADEFTDVDTDGMADYWEKTKFGSISVTDGTDDTDRDALNNFNEYLNQTEPHDRDTDRDLAVDGWEISNGYDPLDRDMDDDGMWDGWEALHALNAFSNDATLNPDGDPHDNLQEFTADTNPRDSNSVLRLVAVRAQWDGTRIAWKGGVSTWLFLEGNSDLTRKDGWEQIVAFPPPQSVTNGVILFGPPPVRFYRIRATRE